MVQIGTWGNGEGRGGANETCIKNYERHYSNITRTTYESDPIHNILLQDSVDWRTYGYCCSGMLFTVNRKKVKLCKKYQNLELKLHKNRTRKLKLFEPYTKYAKIANKFLKYFLENN